MTKRNKVAAQGKKNKVGSSCLVLNSSYIICYLSHFLFSLPIGRFSRWQTEEGKYGRQEEII